MMDGRVLHEWAPVSAMPSASSTAAYPSEGLRRSASPIYKESMPRAGDSPAPASRAQSPAVLRCSPSTHGARPPLPRRDARAPASSPGRHDKYEAGLEVTVGSVKVRCTKALGRGSFGEVWAGEVLGSGIEVALKDILCSSQDELDQAMFEVELLQQLPGPGMALPSYLGHSVDLRHDRSRLRIAMTRVPGETLDAFLVRPCSELDGPNAIRRGCHLGTQLLKQLGVTLERINRLAYHRDVNARNVLVSDAHTGGSFDPEGSPENARFFLIDFGLAVRARTWSSAWQSSSIAGDCRYWPESAWRMSFHGPESVSEGPGLQLQYERKLDSYSLGLMALELLCTPALARKPGDTDDLRGSWRRLLVAWTNYRTQVTDWHRQIYEVFAVGADITPLHRKFANEKLIEKLRGHVVGLRKCLRACIDRTQDPKIQNLLWVIAELIDEDSAVSLSKAVQVVSGEGIYGRGSHSSASDKRTHSVSAHAPDRSSERLAGSPSRPPSQGRARVPLRSHVPRTHGQSVRSNPDFEQGDIRPRVLLAH